MINPNPNQKSLKLWGALYICPPARYNRSVVYINYNNTASNQQSINSPKSIIFKNMIGVNNFWIFYLIFYGKFIVASNKFQKIAIIGGGNWGSTIASLIAEKSDRLNG